MTHIKATALKKTAPEICRASVRGAIIACSLAVLAPAALMTASSYAQDGMPNACPVDGCSVRILEVSQAGDELALTFGANFLPDLSKNHVHVWWRESYAIEQVSNNAETAYGVTQGDWHPTDDYPSYRTQGAASAHAREGAVTLCVTAADRNHDILDATAFHCVNVSDKL